MIPIILAALVGIGSSTPDVRMDEHGRWHFNWIDQDRFGLSRYGTDGWERIPDVSFGQTQEEEEETRELREQELQQEIDELRAELEHERAWNKGSLELGGLSLDEDDY